MAHVWLTYVLVVVICWCKIVSQEELEANFDQDPKTK